ncbi:hypothetical protein [Rubrivirga sp.]|uniref:hypothetical protein n=1 Tax=Rubrivirga sp. TaxID=1885344 RepID=UPI003C70DB82
MRLLALAGLLALAAPANAQLIPSIDLGVAGGLNFASLGDAGQFDLDSSTGYHIGLYADVGVLFFSARTGVYYVKAGDIRDVRRPNADDLEDSAAYVAVPVDFQLKTPTPVLQAYVLAGPEFRFPVSGLETFEQENMTVAGNVGLGIRGGVPLIGPSGYVELRYGLDLTGLNSESTTADDEVKLNVVFLRVGLGI